MNDEAISRTAVLDLIETCNSDGLKGIFCSYDDGKRFESYVKELPPVTPMYTDEEIERAQVVEQAYVDKMVELSVNDVLDKIRNEITMLHIFNRANVIEIIDKYKAKSEE